MRVVVVNGAGIDSMEQAHVRIREQMHFPDYYGKNLDALYDLLSTEDRYILLLFFDSKGLVNRLGQQGEKLVETFQDAALANQRIRFMRVERRRESI